MFGLRGPRHILLGLLLVAAAIPYLVNLGVSSIWDANEAFYAQTPREMMEAGDYVTPSFNFQLRMNKPVLSYWNVAASYHLFGVSEWSERLPIALGGLAIVAIALGLGALLGGTTAGLMSAIVIATSPRLMLLARRIIIDVHITMWMGLVLLFFALSETQPVRRRLYLMSDVCRRRLRRPHQRTRRRLSPGGRVRGVPGLAAAIARSSAHDAAVRRADQPGHRRALVLLPLPRARLGVHRCLHRRREPRTIRRGGRGAVARAAVLSARDARGSVSMVAADSCRDLVGRP